MVLSSTCTSSCATKKCCRGKIPAGSLSEINRGLQFPRLQFICFLSSSVTQVYKHTPIH